MSPFVLFFFIFVSLSCVSSRPILSFSHEGAPLRASPTASGNPSILTQEELGVVGVKATYRNSLSQTTLGPDGRDDTPSSHSMSSHDISLDRVKIHTFPAYPSEDPPEGGSSHHTLIVHRPPETDDGNEDDAVWQQTSGETPRGYELILGQPILHASLFSHGLSISQTISGFIFSSRSSPGLVETQRYDTSVVQLSDQSLWNFVPDTLAASIYQSIDGSALTDVNGLGAIWTLPCEAEVQLEVYLGDTQLPIHPLDLSIRNFRPSGVELQEGICFGTFRPHPQSPSNEDFVSIQLGLTFLRNVHVAIHRTAGAVDVPIQLFSSSDPTHFHEEFLRQRSKPLADLPGYPSRPHHWRSHLSHRGLGQPHRPPSQWVVFAAMGVFMVCVFSLACACALCRAFCCGGGTQKRTVSKHMRSPSDVGLPSYTQDISPPPYSQCV